MSDTPRTEAEVNRHKCWSDYLITIDANFACQLERELNAAKQRIKRLYREVELLRLYGNKDCTAMADEALEKEAKP